MIQITNNDLPYLYDCIYPCGEDAIKFVVNNDLRGDTPQIGLTITQNSLQFIKEDADEVRSLIGSGYDYNVNINNLVVMQLDFANYEDDDNFVKVPLISSSVKAFLQNTTLENLGLTKTFAAKFKKKPSMFFVYYNESTFNGSIGTAHELAAPNYEVICGSPVNFETEDTGSNRNSLARKIPLEENTTTGSNFTFNIKIKGIINNTTDPQTNRTLQIGLYNGLYASIGGSEYRIAGSANPIVNEESVPIGQEFSISTSFSATTYLSSQSKFSGNDISSAKQRYGIAYAIKMESPYPTGNYDYDLHFEIEIIGTFANIDYELPAITINSIRQALTARGMNISILPSSNDYFITSPNLDKLNNIKVMDIVSFFAKMQGKILYFGIDSCAGLPFDYIFGLPLQNAQHRCKVVKKGFALDYSYIIGETPSELRLTNVPEYMWGNVYSTPRDSKLMKQSNISQPNIITDGAEILKILISNEKQSFLIDNTNNNISSNDDTPLNYNFAACMIAKNNIVRIVSNSQNGVTTYTPDDASGVTYTIPNSGGVTTSQSITYPASSDRLSPYVEEFDIPMTTAMISGILNDGVFIRLRVDGQDFCVESCEFGVKPSQVHITARKVM